MTEPGDDKKKLRCEMRDRLARLSADEVVTESRIIREHCPLEPGLRVALFAGGPREPQLLDLIENEPGISWFLPRITGPHTMEFMAVTRLTSLKPGKFNILEPPLSPPAASLDVIICPGLAFTEAGDRLGQGGGFYDRILDRFPRATKIGVAFSCQLLPALPVEAHDHRMDLVLSPGLEP